MRTPANLLLGLGYALALGLLSLMIWVNFAPAQAHIVSGETQDVIAAPSSSVAPPAAPAPAQPVVPPNPATSAGDAPLGNFPIDGETRGNCNPVEPNTQGRCGDPINTATGNFAESIVDLTVPGRGPALAFARTYNSLNAGVDGPLGFGWTHTYSMYVQAVTGGLNVYQENGSTAPFDGSPPNYTPLQNRPLAKLYRNPVGGTFIFTHTHGLEMYYFNALTSTVAPGKLTKIVDRNGYTTVLTYNVGGQLQTVGDPAGRTLTFAYSQTTGLLTSVSDDTGGRAVTFGYNVAARELTSVTDVAGKTTSFAYDVGGHHYLEQITDPNTGQTQNTYDSAGRVLTQQDPMSRLLTIHYNFDSNGRSDVTRVTDTLGLVTVYNYTSHQNRINSIVFNAGAPAAQRATWTFGWDDGTYPEGLKSVTDPNSHVWHTYWDSSGNVLSTTTPLNYATYYRYNTTNDLLVLTNTRGITTTFDYDSHGNPKAITRPLTATNELARTQFTYDGSDLVDITDPLNRVWSFGYDSYGYVLTTTNPLNATTNYSHDNIGRLLSLTTPRNYTANFAYNAHGDPTTITDTLGYTTTFRYDGNRNLLVLTNTKGITTTTTYNLDNEVTRVTSADDTHSDYGYDGDGNLISQSNGLGQSTAYGYDAFNRVMTVTTPLTRTAVYSYDLAGNLKILTDAQGLPIKFGYDAANQLTSIDYYSPTVTPKVSFAYDPLGQRTGMTDGTGKNTYIYDSLDRLISVADGLGATVGYSYDLAGRLTALNYPAAGGGLSRAVTRAYDEANRKITLTDWLGSKYDFHYDLDGNLDSLDYPNGVTGSRAYDGADQLSTLDYSLSGSSFLDWSYTRDPLGLLDTAAESGAGIDTYEYDKLSWLVGDGLSSPTISRTWGYDGAYEITDTRYQAGSSTPITTTRGYNAGNQLVKLKEGPSGGALTRDLSFSYSTTGNRIQQFDYVSSQTINYTYDQANRLIDYNSIRQYVYNGDGLRLRKSTNIGWQNYTWDVGAGLPLLLQDGTGSYIYGPGGELVAQVAANGNSYYYHADQLGSVRALTDNHGAVVNSYQYDAYGNTTASSVTVGNPFGFAGEYTDVESGLVYLRARYYDPATQQFLTVDPLLAATEQAYNYAGGNPTNVIDPTGRFPWLLAGLVGGGVAGFGAYAYTHQNNFSWGEAAAWTVGGAATGTLFAAGGEWLLGAVGSRLAVGAAGAAAASPWLLPPFRRGVVIENMLGRSPFLAQNFPVIDRFANGVGTSIKSIDLNAPSYQSLTNLAGKVQSYCNTMSNWQGQVSQWGGVRILPNQITGRAVDLAIPTGASPAQLNVLQQIQQWATGLPNPVQLNIITIP